MISGLNLQSKCFLDVGEFLLSVFLALPQMVFDYPPSEAAQG